MRNVPYVQPKLDSILKLCQVFLIDANLYFMLDTDFFLLLVIIYGAAGVGFAFMAQNLGGTVLQVIYNIRIYIVIPWLIPTTPLGGDPERNSVRN